MTVNKLQVVRSPINQISRRNSFVKIRLGEDICFSIFVQGSMEKNGDFSGGDNKSLPDVQINGENPVLTSNLFLDLVGEVVLTINSDGLSWNLVESICKVSSLLSSLSLSQVNCALM